MPPRLRIVEGDRAAHCIAEVDLAFDQIVPAGCVGVLEISHKDIGAAIERVDHHLAVGRAGDFDAAVLNIAGDRHDPPLGVPDRLGLGQEIGFPRRVEALL